MADTRQGNSMRGGGNEPPAGVAGAPPAVLEPFMGMKVRRRSSSSKIFKGDYLNLTGNQTVLKLLSKQGDKAVLFADTVLKVDRRAKMVKRLLLITDLALHILEPDTFKLKRRILLQQIEAVCLSELNDNFFAVIVPSEYDYFLASTRKTEIVTVLVEATKKLGNINPVHVNFSNRFEYVIDSENVREVQFEQTEGSFFLPF
eukprot:TRINITY_DN4212_c0_g1_i2.p1 TRINITY_DN4212_c0_g1~~TRINITY_DN4212_c0_g1_i2.p1  ORF type:complete len:202 (-),score=35.60 TRINITY_DN4212_c0_g1_i2:73-678(-)